MLPMMMLMLMFMLMLTVCRSEAAPDDQASSDISVIGAYSAILLATLMLQVPHPKRINRFSVSKSHADAAAPAQPEGCDSAHAWWQPAAGGGHHLAVPGLSRGSKRGQQGHEEGADQAAAGACGGSGGGAGWVLLMVAVMVVLLVVLLIVRDIPSRRK